MKRMILISIMSGLLISTFFIIHDILGANRDVQKNIIRHLNYTNDTAFYVIDLPMGLDTMAFTASINLDSNKKNHVIKLPNGGTSTQVLLYPDDYLGIMTTNPAHKAIALVKGDFSSNKKVLLDISSLKRGKYYVHYLSCSMGGIFPLEIK
jgi:hypothetical protein